MNVFGPSVNIPEPSRNVHHGMCTTECAPRNVHHVTFWKVPGSFRKIPGGFREAIFKYFQAWAQKSFQEASRKLLLGISKPKHKKCSMQLAKNRLGLAGSAFCIYKYVAEIGPGCGRMHSTLHSAQRIRPRGRAARDGERGAGGRFARLERRLIRGDLAQRLAKLLSIHTGAHTHRRSDTVVGRTFPPRQGGRARKGTGNGTRSGEGASRTR